MDIGVFDLQVTEKTVTELARILRESYDCRLYTIRTDMLILVIEYVEAYPYLILLDKNKWDAVTCLMYSVNCGGGEKP